MSKLQQHIEELFDKQFPLIRETGIEEVEGVFFSKDDSEKVKSFIATILDEATKEAWIDGFMTSGEGFNGEYLGSSITKGRTIRETVTTDIYEGEHNLIKEDK